jgi:hypothetical protein
VVLGVRRGHSVRVASGHRAASDDGEILLIVDRRLWIQTLLRAHTAKVGIVGRLWQVRGIRMRPRIVADEMQVLAGRGGDTE